MQDDRQTRKTSRCRCWVRRAILAPALVALGVALACRPESESAPPPPPPGRFIASYGPAEPEFEDFRAGLQANRFLDTVAARLNGDYVLPANITLATGHCDDPNASYEPTTRRVTLCYELFSYLSDQFAHEQMGPELIGGTLVFALAHELAHALIDVLQIPTTGREEDAADQLATLLLLNQGTAGDTLAFGAVAWFAENAQSRTVDTLSFADDHAFDLQRFYNVMCWVYGRDPTRYPDLVSEEWLPAHRASRCQTEYARIAENWGRLLLPHRRTPDREG